MGKGLDGVTLSQHAGSAAVVDSPRGGRLEDGREDGAGEGEEEARDGQRGARPWKRWSRKARRHLSRDKDRGRRKDRGMMRRQCQRSLLHLTWQQGDGHNAGPRRGRRCEEGPGGLIQCSR